MAETVVVAVLVEIKSKGVLGQGVMPNVPAVLEVMTQFCVVLPRFVIEKLPEVSRLR